MKHCLDKPLVSVIIPTYRGAKHVEKALKSVLCQSYENTEIIVVDDNGKDTENQKQTQKVLEKYIEEGRIAYVTMEKHANGSAARNKGLYASDGEYIQFLDDDDILLPEKIQEQVNALEKTGAQMAYCGGYYVKENGRGFCEKPKQSKNIFLEYLTGKYVFNTSALLVRRDAAIQIGGFDESFERHQDWEFCTRIFLRYDAVAIKKPLIIKIRTSRNEPHEIDSIKKHMEHFLDVRSGEIATLGEKHERRVYEYHYRRVAREALARKNMRKMFDMLCKCRHPSMACATFLIEQVRRLLKKIFINRRYNIKDIGGEL